MTPPALAAARFLTACALGAGLGVVYGFLRPLRPRHTWLADSVFVAALLYGALVLWFAVCRADIRMGYTAGLFLGWFVWEKTASRLLAPVFRLFWTGIRRLMDVILAPARFFCKKFFTFSKNLFATLKKWVTMVWNIRRRSRRLSGGPAHEKSLSQYQAGNSAQQHPDQAGGAGSGRTVYGDLAGSGKRHHKRARPHGAVPGGSHRP